ncbi:L,D-transpeptidase [Amycolatopsis nigrescens]|uniref:L,D-transpeptidase n=1 Tax=Amycolatopsis nigrescens TaxID=381445 RepID=UPI000382579A|nr:L,D-transpeptidase [Amycolatopsis nigrescens]
MEKTDGRRLATGRKRLFALAGVAALALLTAACGAEAAPQPAPVGQEGLTELPDATTYGDIPDAGRDPATPPTGDVLHPKNDLVVYQEVGGKPVAKLPAQQLGSPTWVPVVAEKDGWAQVLLPSRPNASAGWVHTDGATVERAKNEYVVNVDLNAFQLEIQHNAKPAGKWTIGIGKPAYPTPRTRAYIMASIEETVNKYSPIVLPLSVHSDSHETFGGGPGTVGIHTWPDESFVGKADSDGCIRVTKDALDRLVDLPLGTIVNIT